jgi:FtsP/CotA-like multicopper oxidase with cupredoxin domain
MKPGRGAIAVMEWSMDSKRRILLGGVAATLAAPVAVGRAWAVEAGAALPLPAVVEAGSAGAAPLEAIAGLREFVGGVRTPVLGFGQPYLGPVLRMRRGSTARIDVRNRIDEAITVHWHGLHVPGAVDGGPHSQIAPGGRWSPSLEIDQPAATLWYHSHVHGQTGPQVYQGLAGMLIIDDPGAVDSGLPVSYGVDDLPLIIQDRAFGRDGQLVYSTSGMAMMAGFRADQILVNGAIRPEAVVPAGVVRLRLLNASNARIYRLRFEDGRAMQQIASDGGLLPRPVGLRGLTLAPGERAELLVDFGGGGRARLLSEPDRNTPMGGMMGGMGGMGGGRGMGGMMGAAVQPQSVAADGAFEVMRFAVDPKRAAAVRVLPARLAAAAPLPAFGEPVRQRRFELDAHAGMMGGGMGRGGMRGMGMMTINGRAFDMARIDHRVRRGDTELWEIAARDMAHPFHVHGTSFQVLSHNGAPLDFATTGWKDTVLVEGRAQLLVRFMHPADDAAPYMFHCHILEHEDAGMMGQFAVA